MNNSCATPDKSTRPIATQPLSCPSCDSDNLVIRHCKMLCKNCGYVESCEDNFLPLQDNPS